MVLELHAAKASGGTAPGSNDPLTTQWFDTSLNGNHGTLTGFTGMPWSADRLTFDGVNDIVNCGSSAALDITGDATLEAWVAFRSAGAYPCIIGRGSSDSTAAYLQLRRDGVSGGRLYAPTSLGQLYFGDGSETAVDGQLRHVVLTRTRTTGLMRLYVAASQVGSDQYLVPGGYLTSGGITTVGNIGLLSRQLPGDIGLARIYPFALMPEQVAANYAAGLEWAEPISRRPSGLLVYQSGRSVLSWQ
jgi:hypothetical protein